MPARAGVSAIVGHFDHFIFTKKSTVSIVVLSIEVEPAIAGSNHLYIYYSIPTTTNN